MQVVWQHAGPCEVDATLLPPQLHRLSPAASPASATLASPPATANVSCCCMPAHCTGPPPLLCMQASAVVRPVGPASDRVPSLHFSVRVTGIRKAAFDAQKLAAWKAALKAALPGGSHRLCRPGSGASIACAALCSSTYPLGSACCKFLRQQPLLPIVFTIVCRSGRAGHHCSYY